MCDITILSTIVLINKSIKCLYFRFVRLYDTEHISALHNRNHWDNWTVFYKILFIIFQSKLLLQYRRILLNTNTRILICLRCWWIQQSWFAVYIVHNQCIVLMKGYYKTRVQKPLLQLSFFENLATQEITSCVHSSELQFQQNPFLLFNSLQTYKLFIYHKSFFDGLDRIKVY